MTSATRRPRLTRTALWVLVAAVAAILLGTFVRGVGPRRARAAAERQEARVRRFVRDEPLANLMLRTPRDGLTGTLYLLGIRRFAEERGERALERINHLDPKQGL